MRRTVVPYAGTWIEIFADIVDAIHVVQVVPYAGTWIEIRGQWRLHRVFLVVPYAGTWIEMQCAITNHRRWAIVVPYAGTWIEMCAAEHTGSTAPCRPLRGDVD